MLRLRTIPCDSTIQSHRTALDVCELDNGLAVAHDLL